MPRGGRHRRLVSRGAWRLYTPGRRLRESGVLFALKARLTTQAVRDNITLQATVVTVAASSASASITPVSFGAARVRAAKTAAQSDRSPRACCELAGAPEAPETRIEGNRRD